MIEVFQSAFHHDVSKLIGTKSNQVIKIQSNNFSFTLVTILYDNLLL